MVDRYLEFVEARARHNTLLATASDLRVFFTEIDKEPADVVVTDVLAFITAQRQPLFEGKVVRLSDGESGLTASTIKRRLSSLSGFFSFLVMIGERESNPVPKGLSTRRSRKDKGALAPLVRTPRVLPQDPRARRGGRLDGSAPTLARPGHGRSHGPRRTAALRGARTSSGGSASR